MIGLSEISAVSKKYRIRNSKLEYQQSKAYQKRYRERNSEKLKVYSKAYRDKHPDEYAAYKKEWYRLNKERLAKKSREYYINNRSEQGARNRLWASKNRLKVLAYRKHYYATHRLHLLEKMRAWAIANPDKRRAIVTKWSNKHKATPKGNLDGRMSKAIHSALRGKKAGRRWESLVGYTAQDLARHIEHQFSAGMNWRKLLNGEIHIDHVIPKSKFHYSSPDEIQFKRCWSLDNLSPKWAHHNLSKHDRLEKPEQIPLGI